MKYNGFPEPQGLYHPAFEHDACGIGLIANIHGAKSRAIVTDALDILYKLKHRGGQGADPSTGDGAGILTQIPHDLFAEELAREGVTLPLPGEYGVGMLFLPQDASARAAFEGHIEDAVLAEGFSILHWRTVPVDDSVLGVGARASKPIIRQVFIAPQPKSAQLGNGELERKLYVIRRQAEIACETAIQTQTASGTAYFASLSNRTIVYKGLVLPEHLSVFYRDLANPDYVSALALVHSRFSTNTFPSWERAHPYRYMVHNGEINTIKGNVNWMRARERGLNASSFADIEKIRPIVDENGSDSSMFDNVLEFLLLSGHSLPHAGMMMIPEPWLKDKTMSEEKRAFYEYHSNIMEPWDGPAAVAFTDGVRIAACLDRNGLRPSRYYVTSDDRIIMSSEVGVVDVAPELIIRKDRLRPGQMLLVDTEQGRIIPDAEIKSDIAAQQPYRERLDKLIVNGGDLAAAEQSGEVNEESVMRHLRAFGFTHEELNKIIKPLAVNGEDPIGSMGYDGPLAVLSKKPQLLYNYFKQMFAQVTNPPIDATLEEMITSVETMLGPEFPLLANGEAEPRRLRFQTPVLSNEQLAALAGNAISGLETVKLPMLFAVQEGGAGLERALNALFAAADQAIAAGAKIIVLSDRGIDAEHAPIPALLAISGLHHHLIRSGTRTKVGLAAETGEAREVHHLAMLLGYGANAINPYMAFDAIAAMIQRGDISDLSREEAAAHYIKGTTKGIMKILSKMGISTVQSYIGAQIFEAIGISEEVIDAYFPSTPSRLGGLRLDKIAEETANRHRLGFNAEEKPQLESGDDFQWRKNGEEHLFNPKTIHTLQYACRENKYDLFKEYAELLNEEMMANNTLRGLLQIESDRTPVPIEEVESIESIVRRFKTGAMSYGSISKEAHEALAVAMNRLGGKSNSGEGGEEAERFVADENGDLRGSAIKQVASGRFGVTGHYLLNADEIQIKMAQGAKPGEGGQLPGHKVYPWIAKARGSTPGVDLISPPPHHDIYSIEDLAELIYDLRNANPKARINVKLVSEAGVGTIAAGVAKAQADVILISGFDGGTGAAARSSIKHAGIPWEVGLAEAHQTLVVNGLRDRITLETDGKLMTGRDIIIAALLGAEEYGFATVPLVVLGCVMMRVCHLDTCPVGIATQNPELRAKFAGSADHVVNFMRFIAQDVREWLAKLGYRSLNELIGRTDLLSKRITDVHEKAASVDLSLLLHRTEGGQPLQYPAELIDRGLDETLDRTRIIPAFAQALEKGEPAEADFAITNVDRTVGTLLGSELTARYGAEGLPDGTYTLNLRGSAGQSFGAFVPRGITLKLEGDANDHVGKGLSGGIIAIYPPKSSPFVPEHNIIVGNVAFYGATSGEAYIRGEAGERFCVRNSGAHVVVEGVGNHGCEYMTGGRVVVLGRIGQNFAAGMSGGIAYVLGDSLAAVRNLCNTKLVEIEPLQDEEEAAVVRGMVERHIQYTGSAYAKALLAEWEQTMKRFVRIVPRDYMRIVTLIEQYRKTGSSKEEAEFAAFQTKKEA